MIVTTTQSIDGYKITGYYGIVFGEVITGINIFKDFGAGIRNIVGGRSQGYEDELLSARNEALQELEQRAAEMGAHAVVGSRHGLRSSWPRQHVDGYCIGNCCYRRSNLNSIGLTSIILHKFKPIQNRHPKKNQGWRFILLLPYF